MSSGPKLSIVTVVYNDLKALIKTVNSVVQLEFDDLEYLIVDGGSTDGTQEYIQSLSLPYLKWISEDDRGIFDAFNKGIKLATGAWVHLLNAGDVYNESNVFSKIDFSVNCSIGMCTCTIEVDREICGLSLGCKVNGRLTVLLKSLSDNSVVDQAV